MTFHYFFEIYYDNFQHFSINRWSVESIFSKNLLSILHLLLAIVHFYQIKDKLYLDLPKVLKVDVIVIKRSNGQTLYEREKENLFGWVLKYFSNSTFITRNKILIQTIMNWKIVWFDNISAIFLLKEMTLISSWTMTRKNITKSNRNSFPLLT